MTSEFGVPSDFTGQVKVKIFDISAELNWRAKNDVKREQSQWIGVNGISYTCKYNFEHPFCDHIPDQGHLMSRGQNAKVGTYIPT